tara:strand:+ start:1130 stop:1936 length:807 start_codon:yes stop_codon:yes gene_type:complete
MSTLRVSNIEAKADASSPSVNEKIKITNSNGDVLVHVNGEISGITTIGINTTGESVKFDSNQNATFSGIVTATQFFGDITGNVTGNIDVGAGNTVTAENYFLRDGINISVPAGTVIYTAQNTAPDGYLKANGANISRTVYADLFAGIGTHYGNGDGSSTFGLPDLRGEFLRAWDDGRGIDSGRAYGTAQGFAQQNITAEWWDENGSAGTHGLGAEGAVSGQNRTSNSTYRQQLESANGGKAVLDASTQITTASEVRPRNIALLACIKY